MSSSMSELLSPPLDSDDDALLFLVENSLIDPDYIWEKAGMLVGTPKKRSWAFEAALSDWK